MIDDEKQNEKTKQDNMIEGGVRKADTAIDPPRESIPAGARNFGLG
jgi:hypothetical protein